MNLKVIILICTIFQCKAWPELGQEANTDQDCLDQFGKEDCSEQGNYTCAKLNGSYVINDTMCDFCKTYGNSNATVYHTGEVTACKELQPGVKLVDDPECRWMSGKNDMCTDEKTGPYCARHQVHVAIIEANNKCKLCSEYGHSEKLVVFQIGESRLCQFSF